MPSVPILALTATATASVQADIIANLRLRTPLVVRTSFNRINLKYTVLSRSSDNDLIRVLLNMQSMYEQNVYEDEDEEENEDEEEDDLAVRLREISGDTGSRIKKRT